MRRPLVYYAISCFIACLSMSVLYENVIIGAVIAASFFAILFFTIDSKALIINILFFIITVISFQMYFNIGINDAVEVRITEKKDYYSLGNYKGRKILLAGKTSKLKEGEKIKAYGNFEGNKDYIRGIVGKYNVKNYIVLKNDFLYYLYDIKRNIYIKFKEKLDEDKSAVIMALCYGDTSYLSQNQKTDFKKLGVFHAVSVSGFHMAIIYKVLEITLGLKFAIIASFIYILFTGIQASAIRAFIMIFILKFSKVVFKNYDSISSLSLAAIILLIIKPYYVSDIGFMLSFLATLGIILYYRKMLKLLYKLPKKLNESLSITLTSQIFSLPYIAFTIQNFSPGFILGNLLLLPMYSFIVILGNIALLVPSINFIFDILVIGLNFILTSIDGANYIILKFYHSIMNLCYLDGVAFILMYFSFLMYKHGYKKYKYLPVFILIAMLIKGYNFIPQVYYFGFYNGEGIVVKYKTESIMICNYEQSSAKDVINLKEEFDIDKVITNPHENSLVKINNDFFIKVIGNKDSYINIGIYDKDKKFIFVSSNVKEYGINLHKVQSIIKFPENKLIRYNLKNDNYNSNNKRILYVIMFNKVFKIYG